MWPHPLRDVYSINHPGSPYPTICNELGKLSNHGDLIVCCDANARTKTLPDSISHPQDKEFTCSPVENTECYTLPRNNSDKVTNAYTNEFLDTLITHKLYILNGRTLGDTYGAFTCEKRNGKRPIAYNQPNKNNSRESNIHYFC